MQLARRRAGNDEPLLVAVVEHTLPAAPGLENAFGDIYRRIHDPAIDHAERFLDPDTAADAVHDAVANIWERWDKLLPEQRTDAFFFGAIHNQVLKHMQRQKRFVELADAEHTLAQMAIEAIDRATVDSDDPDVADVVDSIVGAMPPRRKEVFLLLRERGMSYKEVADALGISTATVNTHLTLAREMLRAGLRRAGFSLESGKANNVLPAGNPEATND